MKPWSYLVIILTLPAIVLGVVRLMLTPLFIQVEYRMPYFPPDPFGFTQADRLYWADVARQYLLNDADISFLGDLRFDDGRPLYNARELRHMVDVKRVVQGALWVWRGALLGLALLGLWAWRSGQWPAYRLALGQGGRLTLVTVGVVLLLVVAAFPVFFVAFHRVFFEGDTWLFNYSDTLIRLFPERFWQDAFLWVGGLSALVGWLLMRWGARQG